jgi:hypothetical protein
VRVDQNHPAAFGGEYRTVTAPWATFRPCVTRSAAASPERERPDHRIALVRFPRGRASDCVRVVAERVPGQGALGASVWTNLTIPPATSADCSVPEGATTSPIAAWLLETDRLGHAGCRALRGRFDDGAAMRGSSATIFPRPAPRTSERPGPKVQGQGGLTLGRRSARALSWCPEDKSTRRRCTPSALIGSRACLPAGGVPRPDEASVISGAVLLIGGGAVAWVS